VSLFINVANKFERLKREMDARDSDGTATAAANGDLPVPKDCQARAESIAQPHPKAGQHD
jgi:hypothetical protein